MDGEFLTIMNAFIAHLHLQTNLVIDMDVKCPKLANRWVIMGKVCTWLLERRVHLFRYLKEHEPVQTPSNWWWTVVASINALTGQVNIIFVKLQAKDLLVSQQSTELDRLASLICIQVGVDGPHSEEHIATIDDTKHFISGQWSVSRFNILKYLFDQGTFIKDLFIPLEPHIQVQVVSMIGQLVLNVVVGITQIQAET